MLKKSALVLTLVLLCLFLTRVGTTRAAVALSFFGGNWQGNTIILRWGTGSETTHTLFNVWRSNENLTIAGGQIDKSRATQVASGIISDAACSPAGHPDYTYTDDSVNASQNTYYYYLESINNCTAGGTSEFEGAIDGSGGLAISRNAGSPTATRTLSPTATNTRGPDNTATATATPQPSNTPAPADTETPQPSNTPAPSNTPNPEPTTAGQPSNTPAPAATNTSVSAPTIAASATRANVPPTATRAGVAPTQTQVRPPTQQANPNLPATVTPQVAQPTQPGNLPRAATNTPALGGFGFGTTPTVETGGGDGAAGGAPFETPSVTTEIAVVAESTDSSAPPDGAPLSSESAGQPTSAESSAVLPPAPTGNQAMSGLPSAATPTIVSVLAQLPTTPQTALIAAEVQSDPLDRVIQVAIALILLGVVALIGFMGWTLVRQR